MMKRKPSNRSKANSVKGINEDPEDDIDQDELQDVVYDYD